MSEHTGTDPVLIIGAGAAGLATAAALKARGVPARVLEKEQRVGGTWRRRHPQLRLNTHRALSGLPGLAIPREAGAFPAAMPLRIIWRPMPAITTFASNTAWKPGASTRRRAAGRSKPQLALKSPVTSSLRRAGTAFPLRPPGQALTASQGGSSMRRTWAISDNTAAGVFSSSGPVTPVLT